MDDIKLINFIFEVGTLRKIARSQVQTLFTNDITDNISSHSYRVAIIGYLLAKKEKADTGKVMLMCLIHDLSEVRSGDQNWINKKYIKVFEDEITKDQFKGLVKDDEIYNIAKEYELRESLESKIAKDADVLEQACGLKEHTAAGNKIAPKWLKSGAGFKALSTKTGKKWAKLILKTGVDDWWNASWTMKRR